MNKKRWVYYISKFTLIDEVLGFAYWALAIYGIFIVTNHVDGKVAMGISLGVYILTVVLIYICVLKKITGYFKTDTK